MLGLGFVPDSFSNCCWGLGFWVSIGVLEGLLGMVFLRENKGKFSSTGSCSPMAVWKSENSNIFPGKE